MSRPEPRRCRAITRAGTRCQRTVGTAGLCNTHRGAAQGWVTKLTPAVTERIAELLRVGGSIELAAAVVGVAHDSLRDWLGREEPQYQVFRQRVEEARAEAEHRNVSLVVAAARDNWQAASWLLERQYPERWGRPSQREKPEAKRAPADPFAEVDQIAEQRRKRTV